MPFLRKYLQDDDYRFEELLNGALLRAIEEAGSIPADRQPSEDEYRSRVKRCEGASADLVEIAAVTAHFGKDQQHDVLLRALKQLATFESRGGIGSMNALRFYPAVLTFYAAGVAAVNKGNFALLRRFHALALVDPGYGLAPALRILSPSYALRGPVQPPREDQRAPKTPLSDRIFEVIKAPVLQLPMLKIKDCYEHVFSEFEYLNALAAAPAKGVHSYYGRFLWFPGVGIRSDNALLETVDGELKDLGKDWPPFKAGLFGADFEAFKKAKAEVDKVAVELSSRW